MTNYQILTCLVLFLDGCLFTLTLMHMIGFRREKRRPVCGVYTMTEDNVIVGVQCFGGKTSGESKNNQSDRA